VEGTCRSSSTQGAVHYEVAGAGFPLVLLHGLPLTGGSWGSLVTSTS
jgi:pimeloyl-ACP methyl ester carboxylesterase